MSHVFIAYSRVNEEFIFIVRQQLQNAGFQVFMDKDIAPGGDWRHEIDGAIRSAFALVVIMTPAAKASEYVTYEWSFAWGAKIPVIPILREDTPLHPRLGAFQHLDFTPTYPADCPWDALFDELRKAEENSVVYNVPQDAPIAVKRAVAALDSFREDERLHALKSLAQTDHPSAIEALAAAIQHPIRDVRVHAGLHLSTITNCQDKRAVPGLLVGLRNADWEVRMQTAEALGKIGDASAVPGLIQVLQDDDYDIRRTAIEALEQIGDASAVPGLIQALQDDDYDIRRTAVKALEQIGDASAVPGLVQALQDNHYDVRASAANALGKIGDASAMPGLAQALQRKGDYFSVRNAAIKASGQIGDVSAVPGLVQALQDDNHDVRASAANALAQIGEVGIPELENQLFDNDEVRSKPRICKHIIEALRQINTPEAHEVIDRWNAQQESE